jgi:hypothetical protein
LDFPAMQILLYFLTYQNDKRILSAMLPRPALEFARTNGEEHFPWRSGRR